MLWPVYVLAALAAVAGVLQIPGLTHEVSSWLEPTVYGAIGMLEPSTSNEWIATLGANVAGIGGGVLAGKLYLDGRTEPVRIPRPLRTLSERKFFWDEAYDVAFYRPAVGIVMAIGRFVERPLVLAPLDLLGRAAGQAGRALGAVQTGLVRAYVLAFAAGIASLVLYFMVQAA